MTASGAFALSGTGGNTGELVVQVTDTGHASIIGVSVACPTTEFASSDCAGLQVNANGFVVSASNPLNKGQTASGSGPLSSAPGTTFTAGTVVTVTATVIFSDGSTVSQVLTIPSQAG